MIRQAISAEQEFEEFEKDHPCSWPGCLHGFGMWWPTLLVWSKKQEPEEKPCIRITVRGPRFCSYCTKNRDLTAVMRNNDNIWLMVRKGFQQRRYLDPNRETIRLCWELVGCKPKGKEIRR